MACKIPLPTAQLVGNLNGLDRVPISISEWLFWSFVLIHSFLNLLFWYTLWCWWVFLLNQHSHFQRVRRQCFIERPWPEPMSGASLQVMFLTWRLFFVVKMFYFILGCHLYYKFVHFCTDISFLIQAGFVDVHADYYQVASSEVKRWC